MRPRRALVRFAAALAMTCSPLLACTLDFDRYDSIDADPEASVQGSMDDAWTQVGAEAPETTQKDVKVDSPGDAAMSRDEGSACSVPATCFQQATSCGAACGQTYQTCTKTCPACMAICTSVLQSCLGKCASTCITCTEDAGCAASSGCLDAAHS